MATAIKILITVTLLYYLSRATTRAVALATGSALVTMSKMAVTQKQRDKLDHATGKAILGAAGAFIVQATIIPLMWVWL